jgi:hypothetical protein
MRAGADPACPKYAFGGGCLAFIDDLRHVTWPRKFRTGITFKYDGTTDPREFLQVYTSDWLLRLPRGSVRSWAHLCEQFVNAFQGGYKCSGTLNDLLALSIARRRHCTALYSTSVSLPMVW